MWGSNARQTSGWGGTSNWKYIANEQSAMYQTGDGKHRFFVAGLGTADATIAWNEAVNIDNTGNLLVGQTIASTTDAGASLRANGSVVGYRSANIAGYFGRTNDGEILRFTSGATVRGSIGTNGGQPYFINSSNKGIRPYTSGVAAAGSAGAFDDAAQDLGASSVRWRNLYLSGGVYLGGTGSSNYLQDYETGTWSPTISFGTATFAGSYYVKIGTQVTVWVNVNDITATTGNDITIGNLPFTSKTQAGNVGSVLWRYFARTSAIDMVSYITSNSTNIQFFWCFNNDGDYDKVTYADGSGSQDMDMIITITYQTT